MFHIRVSQLLSVIFQNDPGVGLFPGNVHHHPTRPHRPCARVAMEHGDTLLAHLGILGLLDPGLGHSGRSLSG